MERTQRAEQRDATTRWLPCRSRQVSRVVAATDCPLPREWKRGGAQAGGEEAGAAAADASVTALEDVPAAALKGGGADGGAAAASLAGAAAGAREGRETAEWRPKAAAASARRTQEE